MREPGLAGHCLLAPRAAPGRACATTVPAGPANEWALLLPQSRPVRAGRRQVREAVPGEETSWPDPACLLPETSGLPGQGRGLRYRLQERRGQLPCCSACRAWVWGRRIPFQKRVATPPCLISMEPRWKEKGGSCWALKQSTHVWGAGPGSQGPRRGANHGPCPQGGSGSWDGPGDKH